MKRYISIDIGGTAIKYGIIGEDAKIMLKNPCRQRLGKVDRLFLIRSSALLTKCLCRTQKLQEYAYLLLEW